MYLSPSVKEALRGTSLCNHILNSKSHVESAEE